MQAEVVFLYAYDVAGELLTERVRSVCGKPVAPLAIPVYRRTPPGFTFFEPSACTLDPLVAESEHGPVDLTVSLRLASIGAMTIVVRGVVEFTVLEDLLACHTLHVGGRPLDAAIHDIATQVLESLRPHLIKPARNLAEPESYTAFCLSPPSDDPAVVIPWFEKSRRRIAALLMGEPDFERLSDQEVLESTEYHFSYYRDDLVVVDWDAALIVDDPRAYAETIRVFELAILQLEELSEYDRVLDRVLAQAYDDLSPKTAHPTRTRSRVHRELREIRIDLARVTDELSNFTKFFGDWHVARVYEGTSQRLHLDDWAHSVSQKLRTLESLYHLLQEERNSRIMLILEAAIVALFVLDLITLLITAK